MNESAGGEAGLRVRVHAENPRWHIIGHMIMARKKYIKARKHAKTRHESETILGQKKIDDLAFPAVLGNGGHDGFEAEGVISFVTSVADEHLVVVARMTTRLADLALGTLPTRAHRRRNLGREREREREREMLGKFS